MLIRPLPAGTDFRPLAPGHAHVVGGWRKRIFDIAASTVALMLLSPLLLFLTAVLVALQGLPVVVRHTRVGHAGVRFPCLKFRTMAVNGEEILRKHLENDPEARAEWQATRKLRQDPRVTSLGHVLRRTSVDELPQLFNILKGEMSLVGPRPIVDQEMIRYGDNIQDYLRARPGLTGLWQISGRNDVSYNDRVHLDSEYTRTWSFATDIQILLKTTAVVVQSRGCY
jgi:exopolysaccharide production protein ExoY